MKQCKKGFFCRPSIKRRQGIIAHYHVDSIMMGQFLDLCKIHCNENVCKLLLFADSVRDLLLPFSKATFLMQLFPKIFFVCAVDL